MQDAKFRAASTVLALEAAMKVHHFVVLSVMAAAFGAGQLHAEDGYVRKVPLDALTVPIPIVPPGTSLDLRPGRAPDASDQINGSHNWQSTTPSIGLSIKSPFDERK